MIVSKTYNRKRAVEYAQKYAKNRNSLFYDFEDVGGNCTNFVSQCILSSGCIMDYRNPFGWYYINKNDRAPAFSGVNEFYRYIVGIGDFSPINLREGPFGEEIAREYAEIGDVIQLCNGSGIFYHTVIITGFSDGEILVSAHSVDSLDRPLSSYEYNLDRFIKIKGINIEIDDSSFCFDNLISEISLPYPEITFMPEKRTVFD